MRKSSPSAFWGTPLAGHLNYLGVDTLITCGESTSGCVRASVVDGCTYRYRMIVVEEGVFDRHEATHAINLFDMHQKYADVVSLAEVLEYQCLARQAGMAAACARQVKRRERNRPTRCSDKPMGTGAPQPGLACRPLSIASRSPIPRGAHATQRDYCSCPAPSLPRPTNTRTTTMAISTTMYAEAIGMLPSSH